MSKEIKLINFSKTQEPSKKRLLILSTMANFRGLFVLSLANIRGYLLSSKDSFKTSFKLNWQINKDNFKKLNSLKQYLSSFELTSHAPIIKNPSTNIYLT